MKSIPAGYIDSLAQSEEHRTILHELEMTSLVAVPLLAHGQLVGSMVVIRSRSHAYSESDLPLIAKVASRAALAVDSARLYQVAQRAIQSRDEVLGIVAHDLRNPLNAILIQASLLRRSSAPTARLATDAAMMIERSVHRMHRLIQDLLDVTRLEGGSLTIEPGRVSPEEVIKDSIQAHELLASSAALQLRADVAPELDEIWADRDRLLQVLDNLIGNALKFTEPGGIITVGARDQAGCVLFWVADTGAGIDREQLPHVFERFWQARKSERRGAGLGLPIVKGIVEAHGGQIRVESALGEGSTFSFAIPKATLIPARSSSS